MMKGLYNRLYAGTARVVGTLVLKVGHWLVHVTNAELWIGSEQRILSSNIFMSWISRGAGNMMQ